MKTKKSMEKMKSWKIKTIFDVIRSNMNIKRKKKKNLTKMLLQDLVRVPIHQYLPHEDALLRHVLVNKFYCGFGFLNVYDFVNVI